MDSETVDTIFKKMSKVTVWFMQTIMHVCQKVRNNPRIYLLVSDGQRLCSF